MPTHTSKSMTPARRAYNALAAQRVTRGIVSLGSALLLLMASTGRADDSGWQYYGGDQGGRHYSSLEQINTENVADLEQAWVFRSGDMETYGRRC